MIVDPMPPRIGDLNLIHTRQGTLGINSIKNPRIFPGEFSTDMRLVQYILNTELSKLEKFHEFDEHHNVFKYRVPGRAPETRFGLDVEFDDQHLKLTLLYNLKETFTGTSAGMLFVPFYSNKQNINFSEVEETLTADSYFIIAANESVENIFRMVFYLIRMREIIIRQEIGVKGVTL